MNEPVPMMLIRNITASAQTPGPPAAPWQPRVIKRIAHVSERDNQFFRTDSNLLEQNQKVASIDEKM